MKFEANEYEELLLKDKIDGDLDETCLNPASHTKWMMLGDPSMLSLDSKEHLQVERRGSLFAMESMEMAFLDSTS